MLFVLWSKIDSGLFLDRARIYVCVCAICTCVVTIGEMYIYIFVPCLFNYEESDSVIPSTLFT